MGKRRELFGDTDNSLMENIAQVIERERLKTGLGKKEHAAELGISIATYFNIQNGSANLTLLQASDIARRLGVSKFELLFGSTVK